MIEYNDQFINDSVSALRDTLYRKLVCAERQMKWFRDRQLNAPKELLSKMHKNLEKQMMLTAQIDALTFFLDENPVKAAS